MNIYLSDQIFNNKSIELIESVSPVGSVIIKFDELKSFKAPKKDFFIISALDGISVLRKYPSTSSFGIFSAEHKNRFDICSYREEKLVLNNEDYFDNIYFCGGAFYKTTDVDYTDDFKNYLDFKQKNIHLLRIEHPNELTTPALFLDRDGVINRDCGYPSKINDITIYNGIRDIIKLANDQKWPVIVVTNQSGIARSYLDEKKLNEIHDFMNDSLSSSNCHIDYFAFCPYHPDGSVEQYAKNSQLRKPLPLMGLKTGERFCVDFENSIMLGDKYSDIFYGLNIPTLLLKSNYISNVKNNTEAKIFNTHEEIFEYLQKIIFSKV
jgi:D-glycero-D-manno-heptose 1,7-bisphosphate phosphatase